MITSRLVCPFWHKIIGLETCCFTWNFIHSVHVVHNFIHSLHVVHNFIHSHCACPTKFGVQMLGRGTCHGGPPCNTVNDVHDCSEAKQLGVNVKPGQISCNTWTKSEYYTHSYKFTLSTSAKASNLSLGLVSYPELCAHSSLVPKRVCDVVCDISCHMAEVEPYFVIIAFSNPELESLAP